MIEVQRISVAFGHRRVLADVSFELRTGEIIALLGANGAGKTTLLRALNGTVPLSEGAITIDSRSVKDLSRREIAQTIAVVAQENETRFPVTVLEFVLSGRFAHGSAFSLAWAAQLCGVESGICSGACFPHAPASAHRTRL